MLFISAGHSNLPTKDQGAIYKPFIEGNEAALFCQTLKNNLDNLLVSNYLDPFENFLKDTLNAYKNLVKKTDFAIDFHFNANENTTISGTEILVNTKTEKTKQIATELLKMISSTLQIESRGIKGEADSQHNRLGFLHLPCESMIVEICFLSNKKDMDKYKKNQQELALKIAFLFAEYNL